MITLISDHQQIEKQFFTDGSFIPSSVISRTFLWDELLSYSEFYDYFLLGYGEPAYLIRVIDNFFL